MRTLLDIVKVALDSRAAQLDPPATQVAHCDPRQLTEAASDLRRLSDKLAAALRVHDGVGLQPPPPRLPAVSDQSPVANEKVLTPGAPAQPAATTGSDDDAMPAHDAPSAQRPTGARVDSAPQAPRSEGLQAGPSAPSPPAVQTGKSTANFAHPVALDQTIVANDEPYSTVLLNVVSPRVVGPDGQASTAEVEKIEIAQAPADSRVVLVLGDDDTPVASGRLSYAQLMGLKAKFITDGCGGSTSFRYRVWYGGRFDDATFNIVRNRIKPKGTCPNDDRSAPSNR